MRGRIRGAMVGLGAVLLLAGCASAPSTPAPTSSAAPSTAAPAPTPTASGDEVDARLSAMSVREKLGAMLMLHYPGTDANALHDFMASTGAGGFILMGDNVPGTADSVAPLSAALAADPSLPPLVGIDQEGGDVSRLDDDTFPAGIQLAATPPEETRTAFASRAQLVRAAGANVNFGVIADETGDSASFIYDRVLGTTPEDAAARVEQAVLGEQGLTISTLKHFPGHGLTEADSHHSLPSSDIPLDAWRSGPAVPFQRGVAAGAGAVMFGHLCLTALDSAPASLSPAWHDLLRTEDGFRGLAITDDMLMLQASGVPEFEDPPENAIRAIDAGNDVLLYVLAADPEVSGVDPAVLLDRLEAAVQDGRIPQARIDESVRRVLEARIAVRDGTPYPAPAAR